MKAVVGEETVLGILGAARPPPESPPVRIEARSSGWRWLRPSRRTRHLLWLVLGIALGVVAYQVLAGNRDELWAAASQLDTVNPGWLIIAALAEALSYLAYASAQRRLLGAAKVSTPAFVLAPVAVAAQAVADAMPVGLAASAVFGYRMLRRYRIPDMVCVWLLAATQLLYLGALGLLALAGLLIAGGGSAVPGLAPAALGLVGVVIALVVVFAVLRRRGKSLWPLVVGALDAAERPFRRWTSTPPPDRRWRERLAAVKPTGADWAASSAVLCVSWLADAACLAVCFPAVAAATPWRGLLVAYCAAQLAASLPITPGGLGVVEGSLTLALVAYGGAGQTTLTAVLLYRILSYWLILPAGLACYGWLRRRAPAESDPAAAGVEAVPIGDKA